MDDCQKLQLGHWAAQGLPVAEIAKKIGCDPSTVYRNLSDEKIRLKVEYCRNLIVNESYQKAAENVNNAIQEYSTTADPIKKNHGYDASKRVLESIGVLPSHSQAPLVANILVQNNNQYISPIVDQVLSQALTGNIIEAEAIEAPQDVVSVAEEPQSSISK